MLTTVRINRQEENFIYGTFGTMIINSRLFCYTLEPPDLLNAVSLSSIPAQQYICQRYKSDNYPDTFQVMHVPDRTKILFHKGNFLENTEGCILLGAQVGRLMNAARGVLNSGDTFKRFMEVMQGINEFHLTIKEVY